VAHPYTLLQTADLIGRNSELSTLTDWVTGQGDRDSTALLVVVAVGGMGKSALTWHWFQTFDQQQWPAARRGPLEGRLWWSFYERDSHFENFVCRALAYVLGRAEGSIRREMPSPYDQSVRLLYELDRRSFLLVLDGLERILVAYAGGNAAYLRDAEDLDEERTAPIGSQYVLPFGVGETAVGGQRRTTDPQVGHFLRQLTRLHASRVLASSRLFPFDLETSTGTPLPGCGSLSITGLS